MRSRMMLCQPVAVALVAVFLFPGFGRADEEDPRASEAFQKSYKTGRNYYGFCMFCHARNGRGTPLPEGGTMAPPLVGSKRVLGSKEVVARIVLHGVTGDIDGVQYEKPGLAMKPPPEMMHGDDEIMAGLLNYIRNSWGNEAPPITGAEVKRIREAEAERDKPWTLKELAERFPDAAEEPAEPEEP